MPGFSSISKAARDPAMDNASPPNVVETKIPSSICSIIYVDGFNSKAADANEDKEISVLDATLIQKYIVGLANDSNIGKTVNIIG